MMAGVRTTHLHKLDTKRGEGVLGIPARGPSSVSLHRLLQQLLTVCCWGRAIVGPILPVGSSISACQEEAIMGSKYHAFQSFQLNLK